MHLNVHAALAIVFMHGMKDLAGSIKLLTACMTHASSLHPRLLTWIVTQVRMPAWHAFAAETYPQCPPLDYDANYRLHTGMGTSHPLLQLIYEPLPSTWHFEHVPELAADALGA